MRQLAGEDAPEVIGLAKRIPDEYLRELARDPRPEVREKVAGKSAMKRLPDVVELLLGDSDSEVRARLCRNGKVPLESLRCLLDDEDEEVAWAAKIKFERNT